MTHSNPIDIDWLVEHSMLAAAKTRARHYSGQGRLWQRPYAAAQPRAASALASAWFTAYPAAVITRPGESVLAALGDETLWDALESIGLQAIHVGPTKQAGGLQGRHFTPTIDGNFDRIGLEIDPTFGTAAEFIAMSRTAAAHNAIVIDDVIPAHTGKGADFRLAELGYADYPGLYHMVEIAPDDWPRLPALPPGQDAVNLSPAMVDALAAKGYIVGQLPRVIFYEPGVKETDWSATGEITGVDGVARRWVYLHYFKAGQPTLNWLDPSFAAQQLILGDALHALDELGARMLRLDANGFLGIERRPDNSVWSEGHPLSVLGNGLIAGLVRKAGGFTFQELNLAVDDIAAMSHGGADLSYDFITRPAYHHALLTGDTEFLRLMLQIMREYAIDPASLIHALQNHDELTLELVHFWMVHHQDHYQFAGQSWTGGELREQLRSVLYAKLTGEHAPYNLRFVTNGVACTTASVIAAALGFTDLTTLTDTQIRQIQQVHLLLVMYNAFQPGVFALSGWDLVGALPLSPETVAPLLVDGDTRWINRGAYDLTDANPEATVSAAGLPKARALYGSLPSQLQQPASFASQLRQLLQIRQRYQIYAAHQLSVPMTQNKALLVLVHQLPNDLGTQITALNFGAEPVHETVVLNDVPPGALRDILTDQMLGEFTQDHQFTVQLDSYAGKAYLINAKTVS